MCVCVVCMCVSSLILAQWLGFHCGTFTQRDSGYSQRLLDIVPGRERKRCRHRMEKWKGAWRILLPHSSLTQGSTSLAWRRVFTVLSRSVIDCFPLGIFADMMDRLTRNNRSFKCYFKANSSMCDVVWLLRLDSIRQQTHTLPFKSLGSLGNAFKIK